MTFSAKVILWQTGIAVAWLIAWQLLSTSGLFNIVVVASPEEVLRNIRNLSNSGELWRAMRTTLYELTVGYVAALAVGTAVGVLMGSSRLAKDFLSPFLSFLNSLPRLALIPVLVAWLGFGTKAPIAMVFLLIVFMVTITVHASIANLPSDFINQARALGASRLQIAQTVYLPAVGIWILGSARIAIGLGFQAVIVAEFFGGTKGLGYLLGLGQQSLDTGLIYAVVIVVAVLAIAGDLILGRVESYVGRWQPK